MRYLATILILTLLSCESKPPDHIPPDKFSKKFETDFRCELQSFLPNDNELDMFEEALKKHLENLTSLGIGFERNVLEKVHPLEYSLGWFKRRYFGRINKNGERKIFTELVPVRCGGSEDWKQIDYPSDSNIACWWSVEYDLTRNEIEKVNYP
ncbi:MAG: hypothetical protein COA33_012235 [Fluviicola sp.]|nr:hypothetical protein [Fluviicola sp.]